MKRIILASMHVIRKQANSWANNVEKVDNACNDAGKIANKLKLRSQFSLIIAIANDFRQTKPLTRYIITWVLGRPWRRQNWLERIDKDCQLANKFILFSDRGSSFPSSANFVCIGFNHKSNKLFWKAAQSKIWQKESNELFLLYICMYICISTWYEY